MPNGKPKIPIVTPYLFLWLDGPIYCPDDGIGFSDQHRPAMSGPTMAHLLLIDDDLALLPEQVRVAFPAPAHTVVVARTGAEDRKSTRLNSSHLVISYAA